MECLYQCIPYMIKWSFCLFVEGTLFWAVKSGCIPYMTFTYFYHVSCSWTFWDWYNNTQVCMQNSVCVSTVIWKYEMEGYMWSEEVAARCSFSCCKCLIKFFFFFSYNYVYFLHLHWANGTLTKGWQMIVFVCTCKNYVYSWKAKFMRTFILIFINS